MLRSLIAGRFALLGGVDPPNSPRPAVPVVPVVPGLTVPAPAPVSQNPQSPNSAVLVEYPQEQNQAGILVTAELDVAYQRVKAKVEAIARECRARNSKFRDIEFDLEEDRERCLHGLATTGDDRSTPADVRRVTQAFKNPQFFVDGANESDVVQGELGDCWFLSGAAAIACKKDLIEKVCVARDEKVGVYGFIFMRDGFWRGVIVTLSLLYTSIPKYEELTPKEKNLYHANKEKYNKNARLGSKSLYFAKSGTENETWVPLLEKAYAKLHGDYASLNGGRAGECIEDLTGGVSTYIHINDILDPDQFWEEELVRANKDRLFSCSIYEMRNSFGPVNDTVSGLFTGHAYSILSAMEIRGKRFLRIRNPWGNSEWTGPWSDGSKEWTSEWLSALEELGHTFGDDGAFVMEYEDFLDTWTVVHRVRLFDPTWIMSSMWINANMRGPGSAWDYGDVSFTFNMPKASPAILVLAQLDDRYFSDLSGSSKFTLDFKLFKKGEKEVLVNSSHSMFFGRSVNAELDLEAGDYVVHVRVDRQPFRNKVSPY
ncbi:cysteine proteinase [Clavulina sp. PMI_390]|nr:cysteine proteinase [Clavulina sp. PMI_390]